MLTKEELERAEIFMPLLTSKPISDLLATKTLELWKDICLNYTVYEKAVENNEKAKRVYTVMKMIFVV